MKKYLHKYSSEGDFNEDYNDDLANVVESFECSAGTFNYLGKGRWFPVTFWKNGSTELLTQSREVAVGDYAANPLDTSEPYEITAVSSDGGVVTAFTCSVGTFVYDREGFFCGNASQNYYSWGNGQRQVLITQFRNAAVGDGDGLSTGAHDLNNNTSVEITQVNTVSRDPAYHEPWVSLTKVNRIEYDYNWYNHVGEVDVYDSETEDYIGKMHLWRREDGRYLIISESETPDTNDTIYNSYISDGKYLIDTAATATATDVQRGPRVDYNKPWWTVRIITSTFDERSFTGKTIVREYSANTISFEEMMAPTFETLGRTALRVSAFTGSEIEPDSVNKFMYGFSDFELAKSDMYVRNPSIYDLENEMFYSDKRGQVYLIMSLKPGRL